MGNFPAEILPLDGNAESVIVVGLVHELNDCNCLNLPVNPALCRWNGSPLDEPEIKKTGNDWRVAYQQTVGIGLGQY